ncbi:MAG: MFS transporter [Proteobacteria bacterium]|nr:MFS transporter [Pseudomonadota bacterium]
MLAMLFAFMLVNFASKTVMGLSAVPIMHELGLSHTEFGTLSASFFYLFALSALIIGFVVNKVRTTPVLLLMVAIWAVCQLIAVAPLGAAALMASRVALGAAEGPAFPVGIHAIFKWFPDSRRALPAAVISQGSSFGVVVALPALNALLLAFSWHWAFGAVGIAAIVWALVWFVVAQEGPIGDEHGAEETPSARIPYTRLLFNRTMLSAWLCAFGAYWGVALLVSWFTPYLTEGLGFSQFAAGWLSTVPWGAAIVVAVWGGWLSERLAARGVSSRVCRGIFGGGMVAFGGVLLLLLPFIPSHALEFVVLVAGLSMGSVIYAMQTAIIAELTPVEQRGGLLAIGTAIWSLAGVVAPVVMGKLIDTNGDPHHGYQLGFVAFGAVSLVAGLIGMVFMQPETTRRHLRAGR